MTQQKKALMWFRQDLRQIDNPALHAAAEFDEILPVYIIDESCPSNAVSGAASNWWLHHSLVSLSKSLNDKLLVLRGNAAELIIQLAEEYNVDAVFWNRQYDLWQIQRDTKLKEKLKTNNVIAKSFNGSLLWEPMDVLKKDGTPYKVFTPYYRKGCLHRTSPRLPLPKPSIKAYISQTQDMQSSINQLSLLPTIKWDTSFYEHWHPGEKGAADNLQDYIEGPADNYQEGRNIPSVKGTSRLSPHFHFGELSPNQAWYAVLDSVDGNIENKDIDVYLSELGWREFSHYLLFHWPTINTENFNHKFNAFRWLDDPASLRDWQFGKTGIPIVDAGMRELYQTGYMHNRIRMVVGSFLVKNLLIDWRQGERWFWDCLLDADMAANSASWQWIAGTGADASPYFRVFNPILQGEKFDKEGLYVKKYCPELSKVPSKFIHKPWEAPSNILNACGVVLGKNYPKPIVDLKASRQRALDAFSASKESLND